MRNRSSCCSPRCRGRRRASLWCRARRCAATPPAARSPTRPGRRRSSRSRCSRRRPARCQSRAVGHRHAGVRHAGERTGRDRRAEEVDDHLRVLVQRDDLDPQCAEVNTSRRCRFRPAGARRCRRAAESRRRSRDPAAAHARCRAGRRWPSRIRPERGQVDSEQVAKHLVPAEPDRRWSPTGASRAACTCAADRRCRGLDLHGAGGSPVRRVPASELDGNRRAVCGVRAGSADQRARGRRDRRAADVRRRRVTGRCMSDLDDAHRAGGRVAAADLDDAAALDVPLPPVSPTVACVVETTSPTGVSATADAGRPLPGRPGRRRGLARAIALVDRCRLGRA